MLLQSIQVGDDFQADIPELSTESASSSTETTTSKHYFANRVKTVQVVTWWYIIWTENMLQKNAGFEFVGCNQDADVGNWVNGNTTSVL